MADTAAPAPDSGSPKGSSGPPEAEPDPWILVSTDEVVERPSDKDKKKEVEHRKVAFYYQADEADEAETAKDEAQE